MIKYSEFQPTGYDSKGLNLPGYQDWLVLPTARNRDSGLIEVSNFETAINRLSDVDEDGAAWEMHRFGHWANGWFEIILVKPDTDADAHKVALEIESNLAEYSILDEDDVSEKKFEEEAQCWTDFGHQDFAQELSDLSDNRHGKDFFLALGEGVLYNVFRDLDGNPEHSGEGCSFNFPSHHWKVKRVLTTYKHARRSILYFLIEKHISDITNKEKSNG